MECSQVNTHIDELLANALGEPLRSAVLLHIEHCDQCARTLRQDRSLHELLRGLPLPPPSPGFHARVLRQAGAGQRRSRSLLTGLALAATLVMGVVLGWMLAPGGEPPASVQAVALLAQQPGSVRLAFESGHDLRDVKLTLHLPSSVELVGYPGQHELTWRTDLRRGRNELSLPLVARDGEGGLLVAQLEHGVQRKQFVVRINVDQTGALPAKNPI